MVRTAVLVLAILGGLVQGGVVSGTVRDAVTKAAITGARVRLFRGDTAAYTAASDGQGQFRFADVREGQYRVEIDGPEHMRLARDHAAARPFVVSEANPDVKLNADLVPRGTATGRVLTPTGEPMQGVPVAMRKVWHTQWVMTTVTGDGGFFRMPRLEPGTWILAAVPSLRIMLGDASKNPKPVAPPGAEDGQRVGWATTFFPGVVDLAAAEKVVVRPGAMVEGHDIRLRTVPVRRVTGVVVDEGDKPVPKAVVMIADVANKGANAAIRTAGADGRFEFESVTDGEWRMVALIGASEQARKGYTELHVGRRDVTGIEVRVTGPFQVKGFVEREEPRDKDGNRKVTAVYLMPEGIGADFRDETFHDQDGAFVLKRVYPGRYRVLPAGLVPGFYVASIWYGDQEVTTRAIDVASPPQTLRIVYRSGRRP